MSGNRTTRLKKYIYTLGNNVHTEIYWYPWILILIKEKFDFQIQYINHTIIKFYLRPPMDSEKKQLTIEDGVNAS